MSSTGRLRAWLELLRLPNLFTVPGDILAGWFLVGGYLGESTHLGALIVASLSLYAAGLVFNDIADRKVDAEERPGRPIPSGRIGLRGAVVLSITLSIMAIAAAALAGTVSAVVCGMLLLCVLAYDFIAKRIRLLGPLTMGICRGLNVVLGASPLLASQGFPSALLAGALIVTVYIAAVTLIAAGETRSVPGTATKLLPSLALVAGGGVLAVPSSEPIVVVALVIPILMTTLAALRLAPTAEPRDVQRFVGTLIGCLIPLQAALVFVGRHTAIVPALAVAALWPLGKLARRYFYAS